MVQAVATLATLTVALLPSALSWDRNRVPPTKTSPQFLLVSEGLGGAATLPPRPPGAEFCSTGVKSGSTCSKADGCSSWWITLLWLSSSWLVVGSFSRGRASPDCMRRHAAHRPCTAGWLLLLATQTRAMLSGTSRRTSSRTTSLRSSTRRLCNAAWLLLLLPACHCQSPSSRCCRASSGMSGGNQAGIDACAPGANCCGPNGCSNCLLIEPGYTDASGYCVSGAAPSPVPMTGASATQSSTSHGGNAGRAIDGNRNVNWSSGSCTHTTNEASPWWEVTVPIAQPLQITSIKVTNRGDCCHERLNGFDLAINGVTCASNNLVGSGVTAQVTCAASAPAGDLTVRATPVHRAKPVPRLHPSTLPRCASYASNVVCAGQNLAVDDTQCTDDLRGGDLGRRGLPTVAPAAARWTTCAACPAWLRHVALDHHCRPSEPVGTCLHRLRVAVSRAFWRIWPGFAHECRQLRWWRRLVVVLGEFRHSVDSMLRHSSRHLLRIDLQHGRWPEPARIQR